MANIFTTDIVVSTLMTCTKSLASWHIAIVVFLRGYLKLI